MKKTIGLIVLLIALSVCVVSLVACDPGSGNQATPQSIQFEDKDGADRSTYWDRRAQRRVLSNSVREGQFSGENCFHN